MISALVVLSCSEEDKKKKRASSFTVPNVAPIVRSATASALLGSSTSLSETIINPAESIKSRLFSTGPTEILAILASLDSTIDSYEARITGTNSGVDENGDLIEVEVHAPCMVTFDSGDGVYYNGVATSLMFDFDGDGTAEFDPGFSQYLNCYEYLDGGTSDWRAFGRYDTSGSTNWYVREGQTSGGSQGGASAMRVVEGTSEAEVWFRVGSSNSVESGSQVIAHLLRSANGLIEYTHTGKGVGYGCGLHMLMANNKIFIKVKTDQETNSQGNVACADYVTANADDPSVLDVEYCFDASNASSFVESTECSGEGLTSSAFTLTDLNYLDTASYTQAHRAFIEEGPPANVALYSIIDNPEEE